MTPAERKKWLERSHVEELIRLLDAGWAVVEEREEPDFVIRHAGGDFGLEVTYAFSDSDTVSRNGSRVRKREGNNHKRLQKLRSEWESGGGATLKVHVLGDLTDETEHEVIQALRALPPAELAKPGTRSETDSGLKIFRWAAFHPEWSLVNDSVGWVTQNATRQIQAAIDLKRAKAESYRSATGPDLRLLVVADYSKASGMLELETPHDVDPREFSAVYFMSYPGGPVQTIATKLPSA